MNALAKNKKVLGVVGVVVLALLVYLLFLKSDSAVIDEFGATGGPSVGADLIELSDKLSKVTLNPQVFNGPTFKSLRDFTLPIPPQPLGRKNPFDVIGRD